MIRRMCADMPQTHHCGGNSCFELNQNNSQPNVGWTLFSSKHVAISSRWCKLLCSHGGHGMTDSMIGACATLHRAIRTRYRQSEHGGFGAIIPPLSLSRGYLASAVSVKLWHQLHICTTSSTRDCDCSDHLWTDLNDVRKIDAPLASALLLQKPKIRRK